MKYYTTIQHRGIIFQIKIEKQSPGTAWAPFPGLASSFPGLVDPLPLGFFPTLLRYKMKKKGVHLKLKHIILIYGMSNKTFYNKMQTLL